VDPTGTVLHDSHAYSMPPEAISLPATLALEDLERIEVSPSKSSDSQGLFRN